MLWSVHSSPVDGRRAPFDRDILDEHGVVKSLDDDDDSGERNLKKIRDAYLLQEGDILLEFSAYTLHRNCEAEWKTFQIKKPSEYEAVCKKYNFANFATNKTIIKGTGGEAREVSSLKSMKFCRPNRITFKGKDDTEFMRLFSRKWGNGNYRQLKEAPYGDKDYKKGPLANMLRDHGVKKGDELLAFTYENTLTYTEGHGDKTWRDDFAAKVKGATEDKPLEMLFLSKDSITLGRRRLNALAERFRRVREYQARM